MEPWMKYTGISLAAGVVTWFRIPRRERQNVRSAFMAMLVFAAVAAAIIVVITLMSCAMPDRP
jgi:signal transduction histidine kinase